MERVMAKTSIMINLDTSRRILILNHLVPPGTYNAMYVNNTANTFGGETAPQMLHHIEHLVLCLIL